MWSKTNGGTFASDQMVDFVYKAIMLMGNSAVPMQHYDMRDNAMNRSNTADVPVLAGPHIAQVIDYSAVFREPHRPQYLIILTDANPGMDSGIFAGPTAQPGIVPGLNLQVAAPGPLQVYDYEEWVGTWQSALGGDPGYSTITKLARSFNSITSLNKALHFFMHNCVGIPPPSNPRYVTNAVGTAGPAPGAGLPNYQTYDYINPPVLGNGAYWYQACNGQYQGARGVYSAGVIPGYLSVDRAEVYWAMPALWGGEWLLLSGFTVQLEDPTVNPYKLNITQFFYSRMWAGVLRSAAATAVLEYMQVPIACFYNIQTANQVPPALQRFSDWKGWGKSPLAVFGQAFMNTMSGFTHTPYKDTTWSDFCLQNLSLGGNVQLVGGLTQLLPRNVDPIVLYVIAKKVPLLFSVCTNLGYGPIFPFVPETNDFRRQRRRFNGVTNNSIQTFVQGGQSNRIFQITSPGLNTIRAQLAYIASNYVGDISAIIPVYGDSTILNFDSGSGAVIRRPIARVQGLLGAQARVRTACRLCADKLAYNVMAIYYNEWIPTTLRLMSERTNILYSWSIDTQAEVYSTSRQTDVDLNNDVWESFMLTSDKKEADPTEVADDIAKKEGTSAVTEAALTI
jgi:hypothetical protein